VIEVGIAGLIPAVVKQAFQLSQRGPLRVPSSKKTPKDKHSLPLVYAYIAVKLTTLWQYKMLVQHCIKFHEHLL
jgi:hypothetical protein